MGAKVQTTQTELLTPQQKALLNSMMTGSSNLMSGMQFGQSWGGPGSTSRQGYGGTPWNTQGGGGKLQSTPMAPIPSSSGYQATNPGNPGASPWGMAAYSDRNQIVSPIVNPFRRNLGG
jgi:hypothetical protein